MEPVKRNVLLNPGPSTTTDTVKYAQVVPDICPREKEFAGLMKGIREDLVKIVHGDLEKYTSVLFCGSGTINIDVCINSLLPEGKKVLVINNGAYSTRAVEVCQFYGLPHIDLKFPVDQRPDLAVVEKTLQDNPDIGLVHITHNETGTGLLNPIREIGALVHKYNAIFTVDTTSTYAMRPIDIEKDNIDFCMASAQKGLMSFTGLSFVVGNRAMFQVHDHGPGCTKESLTLRLRNLFNGLGELLLTHHTASLGILLAKTVIAVIALNKACVVLLLAQVMVGYGRRFYNHHLVVYILHNHTASRSISHCIMVG